MYKEEAKKLGVQFLQKPANIAGTPASLSRMGSATKAAGSRWAVSLVKKPVPSLIQSCACPDPKRLAPPLVNHKSKSPSGFGYHWNHNGVTHYEIGAGMGKGMLELLKSKQ